MFLFECWRKVKGRLLFFFRFYSSKQREEAILEQENIQDHMKLHKKKENAFFYFWVDLSYWVPLSFFFFWSKIGVLSGVMQCIIKSLALLVMYSSYGRTETVFKEIIVWWSKAEFTLIWIKYSSETCERQHWNFTKRMKNKTLVASPFLLNI